MAAICALSGSVWVCQRAGEEVSVSPLIRLVASFLCLSVPDMILTSNLVFHFCFTFFYDCAAGPSIFPICQSAGAV